MKEKILQAYSDKIGSVFDAAPFNVRYCSRVFNMDRKKLMLSIPLLVFFLSLGALNQPGSCLIGVLIILTYMNRLELIPLAIFCEVVFGSLQNLTNITGDIVTAAEFDRKE